MLCAWFIGAISPGKAFAQTTTYSNTISGTISNTATSCSAPLVRTFTVGSGITVADVNIGIYVTHTWRGDLRFTLESPTGTRVQIVNAPGGTSNSTDNFNVLLDDEAAGGSVASYNSAAGASAPPYTITLTPQAALTAFDGQNAAGTWRLEICDMVANDNGNFVRSDLYITQVAPVVYNCPVGTTATGSGYASSGTGAYLNQILWLDWSCGATTTFATGSTINKSWNAGDGLIISGQVTGLTAPLQPYISGTWSGDELYKLYGGLNPIGLRNFDGDDPQFRVTLSATLNGTPVSLRYVTADAEDTGFIAEAMEISTSGTPWTIVEQVGTMTLTFPTSTRARWTDVPQTGGGTTILETTGSSVAFDATITSGGGQAFAFGIFTPFDQSDAPLTAQAMALPGIVLSQSIELVQVSQLKARLMTALMRALMSIMASRYPHL